MTTTADGWSFGVTVTMVHDSNEGEDKAVVHLTTGSDPGGQSVYLGTYTLADLKRLKAEGIA